MSKADSAKALTCQICGRATPPPYLEKHHLIPKSKQGTETIDVCCNCGDQVHKLFSLDELAREYHSLDKLLANPDMQKWIRWVRRKPSFTFSMKTKKPR